VRVVPLDRDAQKGSAVPRDRRDLDPVFLVQTSLLRRGTLGKEERRHL